ncbi:adipocyte plasma membrane-associated protein [Engraulis encrasicolus]|uniref:adipocyte plasma membrane-associated protein n=1 Tax=Engraulis encrasicolus TaxID=184585 RepID=UPI002FD2EC7F
MNEPEGLRFRRLNRPQIITDSHEPRYKGTSTYSGKVFRVTLISIGGFLILPLLVVILILESPIHPEVFSLSEPPLLTGCYEPNLKLREAQRLYENQLLGPESITNIGDVLYTGTADGQILRLDGKSVTVVARLGRPPCGSHDDEPRCGRPLGIRLGPNGTLFVADAYLGIFQVDPVTGHVTPLVRGTEMVAGQRLSFINDLDVSQDGRKVYFTSSSSRWQRRDYLQLIMEATADGRVLEYDVVTRQVSVMMEGLRFPNGIQLLPDEESVLVTETTMARIRRMLQLFSHDVLLRFVPRYSLVLELEEGGLCLRSFHDPHGQVAAYISEAHEHKGHLYLGSFRSPYLCKLDLSQV